MKRSRNEVKATLGSYLKRRNYTDTENFRRSELQLSQTRKQMAVYAVVDKETTHNNSILFCSINNDTTQIDQQFTRLKTWVGELKLESCKTELAKLLCPLFCHLYLEMLRGGHRSSISKFLTRHQGLFTCSEANRELMEELVNVSSSQDMDSNVTVTAFRSRKYHLILSSDAMVLLRKYLSEHGHVILLQVLETWFDLEVCINSTIKEDHDHDEHTSDVLHADNIMNMCNGEIKKEELDEDRALLDLQETIRLVREGPPVPGPCLLYTIMNSDSNVSCGTTSPTIELLSAGFGSEIKLWSLAHKTRFSPSAQHGNVSHIRLSCDQVHQSYEELPRNQSSVVSLLGHCESVQDLAFVSKTNNPGVLLSVSKDATMRAWRLTDYSCASIYRGHNYPIWCVTQSVRMHVATGSSDRTARLWTLDRTFPLRIFAGHTQDVESVKFHPNGSYLATGSTDKTVRLWSVSDAKLVRVLPGHRGGVQALAFSPNGKYIASSGEDKCVRVWDIAAGTLLIEFKGHTQTVISLCWSRDNECVASCSADGTVRVWNCQHISNTSNSHSNSELATYSHGSSSLLSVYYSNTNTLVCLGVKTTKLDTKEQQQPIFILE